MYLCAYPRLLILSAEQENKIAMYLQKGYKLKKVGLLMGFTWNKIPFNAEIIFKLEIPK